MSRTEIAAMYSRPDARLFGALIFGKEALYEHPQTHRFYWS